MKKVINKKLYDTEKAELIATRSNNLGPNNFNFEEEELYRTKTGNWFISFEGGAASRFAQKNHGYSISNTGIIACDNTQAYNFLEIINDIENIQKYFSNIIEEA